MADTKKSIPPTEKGRKTLHITMQGKGGAGKSFVASLICQQYQAKQRDFTAIDLDPINRTLAGIKGLDNVTRWSILHEDTTHVDASRFDDLVEFILDTPNDLIIDTGSTNFMSFNDYLTKTQMLKQLHEQRNIATKIHCVLRAGSSRDDCVLGLNSIAESHEMPTTIVVWLNEVEGRIVSNDGKPFEEFSVYRKHAARIEAINVIAQQTDELYRADMARVLANRHTFDIAIQSPGTGFASKMRLQQLKDHYTSAFALTG